MNGQGAPSYLSLGRMLERTEVPQRSVGIFWLGGPSLAFKSPAQCVYVIDPVFSDREDGGAIGAIDVRPDLVLCTLEGPSGLDVSTLTHLASAYPQAQFVAGETGRDWMIGRLGDAHEDEVPINPARVHVLEPPDALDVHRLSLRDVLRITVLSDAAAGPPWDMLFNFGGIRIFLVRGETDLERLAQVRARIRQRVDVLLWPLRRPDVEAERKGVALFHPRYVIPIEYDRSTDGRSVLRQFRQSVTEVRGVKAYLFPEDYREGLVYSRIMRRKR